MGTEVVEKVDPIVAAQSLHARFGIVAPEDLDVERLAAACGAFVVWRETGSADARVVRAADVAYLAIAASARGTSRARFSIAHELGHHLLHRGVDAIERIHGRPRTRGREFTVEREADRFATELLVPEAMLLARCRLQPPTLQRVEEAARVFEVSLTVAARRWAELADAACAFVESKDGIITKATRSRAFRGIAVQRRRLESRSMAMEALRRGVLAGRLLALGDAWGSSAQVAVVEESMAIGSGRVLTWLWHDG